MSLYGMMVTSASGMAAQSNLLSTVADNIANSDTVGYKKATEHFSSLVLVQSGVGEYNSGVVASHLRRTNTEQGALSYTASPTDLAIQGAGFFVVSGPDASIGLTRAGSFRTDVNGDLVNSAGFKLLGYPTSGGTSPVTNGFAGLVPVNVGALGPIATPSTSGTLTVNFPSESAIIPGAGLPSMNVGTSTFTKMTSLVAYDNVGAEKTLDVYETKTAANTWEIAVFDRSAAASGGGFPYTSGPLATTTLSFDPQNGRLASSSSTDISIPVPGGQTLLLDLTKCTELSGSYSINDARVNGNASSSVDHILVSSSGQVSAIYENGTHIPVFQIPLATVPSPDNLEMRAGNVYYTTLGSGNVVVSLPNSGSLGSIVPNALEKSTVDVATELTQMISSQHSYTANSKVFQTAADLMDVLINLKR